MELFGKRCIFCGKLFKNPDYVWKDLLICICCDCMEWINRQEVVRIFETTPSVSAVIPSTYYYGRVKEAVHQYKFMGQQRYGKGFAYIIKEHIAKWRDDFKLYDAVVTVPVSKQRLNERGYNQSQIFAEAVCEVYGIPICNEYLVKIVDNKRQSGLDMYHRIENIKSAYAASKDVKGKNIILVDDIYTTGTTMEECAKTLKTAGAAVISGITFSAVERKERTPVYNFFKK